MVLEEEMGNRMSSEAKAAWSTGMKYVFAAMMGQPSLSASDITLVRQSYAAIHENSNIAPKVFLRFINFYSFLKSSWLRMTSIFF